jgi:O-antigen/teichoic acid export membrane protein
VFRTSFIKIAFVSGGNIINAGIGFFFLAVVAKTLSLEDFGKYALLTSILLVCVKLIDFGSNSIYVTKYLANEDDKSITETFHSLKLVLLSIVAFISLGIVNYFFPTNVWLSLIFVAGLIAYTINFTFYAHFQKEEKYTQLILLNTLPALVKTIAAILVLLNIIQLNMVNAFAFFSLSIFADVILFPFLPEGAKHFKFNFTHVRTFIIKGLPSGFSQLIQEGWPAVNNTITKYVRNYNDVGTFSLASKISNIFALVSLSIFTVLLPKNARLKGQKKAYDIGETILISLGIIVLAVLAIAVSGMFIRIVFGEKFEGSIKVLDILIFSSAFSAIHTFMENYFLVENQTKNILWVNISKIVVFLIAALLLSTQFGIEGLAYANLLAATTALIVTGVTIARSH